MPADLSVERASHLIGLIYDCVIDPARWPDTVHQLRAELGFVACAMNVVAIEEGVQLLNIASGYSRLDEMPRYTQHAIASWGGAEQIRHFPADEPILASEVVGEGELARNPYIAEWCRPQGICDCMALFSAQDPAMFGGIAFSVHELDRGLVETQRRSLRLLAPHFRRAITIAKLLDMKALAIDTFESTLETLKPAIVLVGEDLDIVHANATARAQLKKRDPIREASGRLALQHLQAAPALADAVARAATSSLELGQCGIAIPTRHRDGSPAILHVLPLRRDSRRSGIAQRAVAAVFVASASSAPQMPAAALALLYDLTPAEARVLELIVEGLAPAEIAKKLGVTLATTRTHLQRVFDKTGHSRQADLVRLVGSLVLPV